ncbi:MAG: AAA family ATPase [Muribaculaceae bacterium]|nr:AAA family ATPase [Muribaculaceae bacterium]
METLADKTSFPLTASGTEAFLAGPMVSGIGSVYAKRLVEKFGTQAIDTLLNSPQEAATVKGLSLAKAQEVAESIRSCPHPVEPVVFMYGCGISDTFIERILHKYRKKTPSVIMADPYGMVEDVWQLSFFTADKIGKALRIQPSDPRRLRGALITAVKHFSEQGHVYAVPEEAVTYAAEITGVSADTVHAQVETVARQGRLILSHGGLYLPVFYRAEKEAARKLRELSSVTLAEVPVSEIPQQDIHGNTYSPTQLSAISMALSSPVAVLTGGPGSGKTTVLRAVTDYMQGSGKKVTLAAPTGRAAKRLSALTGCKASTIHSLLGYRQGEGYSTSSIDTDMLIIDESSMMEQVLFNHLLQALKPGTRVLLVGDVNQLPAIGAGDVMRQLISSGAVPVAVLEENFRQAEGSLIAAGAADINRGRIPQGSSHGDLMIIEENTVAEIHTRIIKLVTEELPAIRGIKPTEIRVISPQQIGPLGARQLNIDLQEKLNPSGPELRRGSTVMRQGDPVMQTANSRERGVYNGEVGIITDVNTELQTLSVTFADGRFSTYHRTELSELVLAYATTVHKLQGSEVRYMILPITMAHKPMLYRNLLYTGVSRATDLCVLVGQPRALEYAVSHTPATERNSNFSHRLQPAD